MKKLSLSIVLLCLVAPFLLVMLPSCSLFPAEFEGTWVNTPSPGVTWTLVATKTSLTMTVSGGAGAESDTINSYDEAANHIQITVNSSSGMFSMDTPGTVYYILYDISGNTMNFAGTTGSYPTATNLGPFTRQ